MLRVQPFRTEMEVVVEMIEVNKDVCIECMTCVAVCPFTVLEESDEGIRMAEGKKCMACMHCGAVCPTEAITYNGEPSILPDEMPTISDTFHKELKNHILTRRSYRHFSEEQVPRTIIEEALELASWAPSAKNQHSTKWMIIEDPDVMDRMMTMILEYVDETGVSPEIASEMETGNNVVMGTAKTLLLAYANDNAISPETDTAIAMTTAELYLQAKGIGTCWAGYLKRMANNIPGIREMLPKIPSSCSFYGAFMLGYPADEEYLHIPQRFKRADIKWV